MINTNSIHIYLIRHGEAGKAWHEDPDPGLSKMGYEQAKSSYDSLRSEIPLANFQLCTSPLLRAMQTAEVFQMFLGEDLITVPVFSEIPSLGVPLSERQNWLKGVFAQTIPELDQNLINWRNQIIDTLQNIDRNTLIFSHFMVINCVVGWIEKNEKLVSFNPGYCSVTHIEKRADRFLIRQKGMDVNTLVR